MKRFALVSLLLAVLPLVAQPSSSPALGLQAVNFDGDTRISWNTLPNSLFLESFTVHLWLSVDDVGLDNQRVLTNLEYTGNYTAAVDIRFLAVNGALHFVFTDLLENPLHLTSATLWANTEYHFSWVVTIDETAVTAYLFQDGVKVDTGSLGPIPLVPSTKALIAGQPGGGSGVGFEGFVASLSIFDH